MGLSNTQSVLDFIDWLTRIRELFRAVHIVAEKDPAFCSVSTRLIPSGSSRLDLGLAFSLMAELKQAKDPEKQALGMSLQLQIDGDKWRLDAEVGWSGVNIGWDIIEDRMFECASIEDMYSQSFSLMTWLSNRFQEECYRGT